MTTANNAPISFRLTDDELELLRQHQEDGEKSLNLTAKRLLLNALGVDAKKPSLQVVNTVDTNQIKELIETAVQEKLTEFTTVDNVDTIKNLIAESLADGKIGEAIATSYKAAIDQLNGLFEELQNLKSQLQELQSIPPAPVPNPQIIEHLTTDNEQMTEQETGNGESETISPVHLQLTTDDGQFTEDVEIALYSTENPSLTEEQIIALFGLESIVIGTRYTKDSLRDDGILDRFAQNQEILSNLGIKYREGISPVNSILKKLNFTVTQHKDKRTYHVGEE